MSDASCATGPLLNSEVAACQPHFNRISRVPVAVRKSCCALRSREYSRGHFCLPQRHRSDALHMGAPSRHEQFTGRSLCSRSEDQQFDCQAASQTARSRASPRQSCHPESARSSILKVLGKCQRRLKLHTFGFHSRLLAACVAELVRILRRCQCMRSSVHYAVAHHAVALCQLDWG